MIQKGPGHAIDPHRRRQSVEPINPNGLPTDLVRSLFTDDTDRPPSLALHTAGLSAPIDLVPIHSTENGDYLPALVPAQGVNWPTFERGRQMPFSPALRLHCHSFCFHRFMCPHIHFFRLAPTIFAQHFPSFLHIEVGRSW